MSGMRVHQETLGGDDDDDDDDVDGDDEGDDDDDDLNNNDGQVSETETRLGEAIVSRAGNLQALEVNLTSSSSLSLSSSFSLSLSLSLSSSPTHHHHLKVFLEQQTKDLHCEHHLMLVLKASAHDVEMQCRVQSPKSESFLTASLIIQTGVIEEYGKLMAQQASAGKSWSLKQVFGISSWYLVFLFGI